MDYKIRKQLDENKNVNSVNRDFTTKILLDRDVKELTEGDVTHYLNVSEQFNIERQNSNKYFIYGGLEFFSILNGMKSNYNMLYNTGEVKFRNFFDKFLEDGDIPKTIYNSFDFYLLKPLSHKSEIDNYELLYESENNKFYVRKFEVIGVNSDFIINNQAFAKNIFNDEKHSYLINKDIVLENNLDWFGKPITELFILSMYKSSYTGHHELEEEIQTQTFTLSGNTINSNFNSITGDTITYEIGDIVYGDVVIWNKEMYNETKFLDKEIKIITNYQEIETGGGVNDRQLKWKYNPLHPIRIDYLANEYNIENISGTTEVNIPDYAIKLDNKGNYIWRDKLDKGFIDNLYNIGVDYPFVNGKHYIYSNHIIKLVPDLSDSFTHTKFQSIIMNGYSPIDNNTDIDNYGKLC